MQRSAMIEQPSPQEAASMQSFSALENTVDQMSCTHREASSWAETILYVEDEAFVRGVTREILHSAGYRVFAAKTAAEAVRIFQEHHFAVDLLLSDVILPGETGQTLAARLRRTNPRLKVLLVTGYGDQMLDREGMHDCYLAKPFSSEALLQRIREVLGRGNLGGNRSAR